MRSSGISVWVHLVFLLIFIVFLCLVGGVNEKIIKPTQRLHRMRQMFASSGGILVEDYEHFTRQDAATRQNKGSRKSVKWHGPQGQALN